MPYIIKWAKKEGEDNIVNPVFRSVTLKATTKHSISTDGVDFIGYYDTLDLDPEGSDDFTAAEVPYIYYMTTGSVLKHTGVARKLKACRAYFKIQATGANAREFILDFGDDEATGISEKGTVKSEEFAPATWYTVDGKKLDGAPTRKGIYIQNGNKVVIK